MYTYTHRDKQPDGIPSIRRCWKPANPQEKSSNPSGNARNIHIHGSQKLKISQSHLHPPLMLERLSYLYVLTAFFQRAGSVAPVLHLYSGGLRFESRQGYWLFWLKFFEVISNLLPLIKIP
jgi:hypothetical protein